MKIKKIILKDYNQFKDLEIDMTYPEGHEKAGKPLDKVCFIGQSGTGKTTLLRLVKRALQSTGLEMNLPELRPKCDIHFSFVQAGETVTFSACMNDSIPAISINWISPGNIDSRVDLFERFNFGGGFGKPACVFFAADDLESMLRVGDSISPLISRNNNVIEFYGKPSVEFLSKLVLEIKDYQAKELQLKQEIADAVLGKQLGIAVQRAQEHFEDWQLAHPNPLARIAEKLNPVIHRFGLEVKTSIDLEAILNMGGLQVSTLSGKHLNRESWSTGTKEIVDKTISLFELAPDRSIILIDEPERSLYPDMQQQVVDFYTSLTTDCQFFYATHSPIIASSFDPWEIVELKFDHTLQNVVQEKNYEGERHVENYTVHPKYLNWSGILMKLFDLKEEGNGDVRTKALMDAMSMKLELEKLKAEGQQGTASYMEKVDKYMALRNKLGWDAKV
jgi:energy-coupling factor transporter ATP-binding protein EcfA2